MNPAAPAGKQATPASLGFVIVENMLHEIGKTGRSPSLERLTSAANAGLDAYAAQAASPVLKKEAESVKQAVDLARQLVMDIAADAKQKR